MARRMRFGTWCKKDINDERKINYIFKGSDGHLYRFTSDDPQRPSMLARLRVAWIHEITLNDNEWTAYLYEE